MRLCRLGFLALGLLGCTPVGPCLWQGQQDRETGMVQGTSLECDGVAKEPRLSVRYLATSEPLGIEIATPSFTARLAFEASLPDGTYSVDPPINVAEDAKHV